MPNRNAGHIDEMTPTNGTAAGNVIKHMVPGASGTRRLVEQFCESLMCVRCRENPVRGLRCVPAGCPQPLTASIGAIVLLVFMVQDSKHSQNQYGANPKKATA